MSTPDIAGLDLDVDISVSAPEDYADSAPLPIPQGSYTFSVGDFELDKDKVTGAVRKSAKGFPTLLIKSLIVAEGPSAGRRVSWLRYSFKPFEREASGKKAIVSQVGDLLRGIDRTFDMSRATVSDVLDRLQRAKDLNETFKARAHYEGFDKDWFEAQAQSQGINTKDYISVAAKKLRKEATLTGKKGFPNGHVGVHPVSGNRITAKVFVNDIYPQKDQAEQVSA